MEPGQIGSDEPHYPMTALTEGQRLGPYRIVRLLGEGGMGAVYEAKQEPLDRRVALKTLHPEYAANKEAVARFFNEAKILSKLEHPSIVQVSDFGNASDGTAYLVMEYLRGQSLGHRVRELSARGERLAVVTSLQFGFQVADVLAVAHAQGIVHRDIKPDNLMLVADAVAPGGERVKLLDFGIAKLTNERDKGGVKTATQTVMGTPSYMSPEQCAGAGGVDAKTDVYALGCVLYEALAGRPPFVAEGAGQLLGMHLFQTPPPLLGLAPKVPQAVADLVHRLLTKDKEARPAMSEAADNIGKLLSKQPGGGLVVRSRVLHSTDPDATRAVPVPSPATTLRQATGQSQIGLLGRSSRTVLTVGGSAAVLFTAVVPLLKLRARAPVQAPARVSSAPATQPVEPAVPTKPVVPERRVLPRTVTWYLDSTPSGASVVDEQGRTLGTTPFQTERPARPGRIVLHLRRDGYSDELLTLSTDRDAEHVVALEPTAPAPTRRLPPKSGTGPPASTSPSIKAKPLAEKRIGFED